MDAAPTAAASFVLLVLEGKGYLGDCVCQCLELRCHFVRFLLCGVTNAGGELVVLLFLGDSRRGDLSNVMA